MSDPFAQIGTALGNFIGGNNAIDTLGSGVNSITGLLAAGAGALQPYNMTGVAPLQSSLSELQNGWQVGVPRIDESLGGFYRNAGLQNVETTNSVGDFYRNAGLADADFSHFASNYSMSPGATFLKDTAESAQNNKAAAGGGFYSGSNMRANDTIAEGIANQDMLSQYQAMLSGNVNALQNKQAQFGDVITGNASGLQAQQQNFNQSEVAFNNLFNQESLGEKAGASQGLIATGGAGSLGSLFGAQANAQQSKGSGVGGLVGAGLSFLSK